MLARDEHGIIIQQPLDINSCDDSLCRTSLLGLADNELDKENIKLWYSMGGEPARHPYTVPANKYGWDEVYKYDKCLSRDQLLPYIALLAVLAEAGDQEAREVAKKIRQRHKLFVNQDFLAPDIQYIMSRAADHWSQYLWGLIGIPWLLCLSIPFTCIITPKHELNQLVAECLGMSKFIRKWSLKMMTKLHPDWKRNIEDYWGVYPTSHGLWRQMPEMAQLLIAKVESIIV